MRERLLARLDEYTFVAQMISGIEKEGWYKRRIEQLNDLAEAALATPEAAPPQCTCAVGAHMRGTQSTTWKDDCAVHGTAANPSGESQTSAPAPLDVRIAREAIERLRTTEDPWRDDVMLVCNLAEQTLEGAGFFYNKNASQPQREARGADEIATLLYNHHLLGKDGSAWCYCGWNPDFTSAKVYEWQWRLHLTAEIHKFTLAAPKPLGETDADKWQRYEREYILPAFEWAKEYGIDLKELVRNSPGKNCVELLVRALGAPKPSPVCSHCADLPRCDGLGECPTDPAPKPLGEEL